MPRYIDVDRAIELIRSGDGTPMEKAMAEAFLMSFTPVEECPQAKEKGGE